MEERPFGSTAKPKEAITYEQDALQPGLTLYLDGRLASLSEITFELFLLGFATIRRTS